jgi:hypothetical protein
MARVLVACEYSGAVRRAFQDLGHDALSIDLLPADDGATHTLCNGRHNGHFQGDVIAFLAKHAGDFDLMIAHPPCTFLSNSGVRWLYQTDENGIKTRNEERWEEMRKGAEFFRALLHAPIPLKCIENPIIHGYAKAIIGTPASQTIQPWMFGHGESKATNLWLVGLPPLMATKIVDGRDQRIWKLSPSPDRWKLRSATYPGIAEAMANQWSTFLEEAA